MKVIKVSEIEKGMVIPDGENMLEVIDIVKDTPKTLTVKFSDDTTKRLLKTATLTVEEPEQVQQEKPKKKKEKMQFYSLKNILAKNADYNIIFGERSNGKTYAAIEYGVKKFVESGYKEQTAILRRWKEDIRGKRAETLYNALTANGCITELTHGEYSEVYYFNGKWYLSNYDTDLQKHVPCSTPLAYSFALSEMEHDKSTSYPNITTVIFDEFLTRRYYLPDEFILFMNVLSTIIRHRNNVKIFMLGNTVNKFCPYFAEMGLRHIGQMEQGTIDVYKFGEDKLTIAVEYTAPMNIEKESNKYFCFDDKESVQMIINGAWEMAIYPHLKTRYKPSDVLFTYFIEFNGNVLQCEIVNKDNEYFTYIHEKTTPIKNPDTDLIYSLEHNEKANYKRRLLSTATPLETKIAKFYALEKVFFQNNEVGEVVRNYIMQSTKSQFAKT
ncbi:MAG: phage DNA encapsidation protein [Candidatus Gastranaerophilaceae bacterium]